MNIEDLQAQKLEAEIEKLRFETRAAKGTLWSRAADFVKVAGAIAVTVAAGYAAITTYRITQLETRLAVSEKEAADREREKSIALRDKATRDVQDAMKTRHEAEREVEMARLATTRALSQRDEAIAQAKAASNARTQASEELNVLKHKLASVRSKVANSNRELRRLEVSAASAADRKRIREISTAINKAIDPHEYKPSLLIVYVGGDAARANAIARAFEMQDWKVSARPTTNISDHSTFNQILCTSGSHAQNVTDQLRGLDAAQTEVVRVPTNATEYEFLLRLSKR